MGYEENAADRWYRRYLDLQDTAKNEYKADTSKGDMDRALAMLEKRLREMNVAVYPARRPTSRAAKAALLAKKQRQLDEAQRQAARAVYREVQGAGMPWAMARQRLMDRIGVEADVAERMLRVVREERSTAAEWAEATKAMDSLSETFRKAYIGEFTPAKPKPQVDTRTSTYTGRRPAPAIAKVRVATFRTTEWADPQYAGTDFGDYPADWVKERKGIQVQDIDGSEVYVAVEAVQRVVAAGEVPGYAALTPEEADSLHLVLVEAEHYQQALLREALVEGDHDPDEVLRVSRANAAQAHYRQRLGLPKHNWTEDCCGAWVAPVTKEVTA